MNKFETISRKEFESIKRKASKNDVPFNVALDDDGRMYLKNPNGQLIQVFNGEEIIYRTQKEIWNKEEKKDAIRVKEVKKAAINSAIAISAGLAFLAWFSVASRLGKQGEANRKQRFDSSYSESYDYVERGK